MLIYRPSFQTLHTVAIYNRGCNFGERKVHRNKNISPNMFEAFPFRLLRKKEINNG